MGLRRCPDRDRVGRGRHIYQPAAQGYQATAGGDVRPELREFDEVAAVEQLPEVGDHPAEGTRPDGMVGVADLLILWSNWNTVGPDGDIDDNGMVDTADLLLLIGWWGS